MDITTKSCTKCGETKALDEFHRDGRRRDGRRPYCGGCAREAARKYSAAHAVERREWHRAYRAANAEQIRERKRARYAENRERVRGQKRAWYAANADRERERQRAYHAAHPEVSWASGYRARAVAFGFTPHVEEFTYADVIETYGNGCAHCTDGEFEHLDHYPVPVALGGLHSLDNVRPSCASCNRAGAGVRAPEAITA